MEKKTWSSEDDLGENTAWRLQAEGIQENTMGPFYIDSRPGAIRPR